MIYVIYRKGVYIQHIIGATTDKEMAKTMASYALEQEEDDYHDICIIEVEDGWLPSYNNHCDIYMHPQHIEPIFAEGKGRPAKWVTVPFNPKTGDIKE